MQAESSVNTVITDLDERSREIFREIVESYMDTGAPVGSRTLSRRLGMELSPATIRNVMADLEELGLLMAPHTSAGRLPTELGLRFFGGGARSELPQDEEEIPLSLIDRRLHPRRHPEIGLIGKGKSPRHDTYDGVLV